MQRTLLWTALIIAAIVGGSYSLYVWLSPEPLPEQLLYGNGHVEGIEIQVAAEVQGRVLESNLVEGIVVRAGDLLITIDDADLRIQIVRAEAELEAVRHQMESASLNLEVWQHHMSVAESDRQRYRDLQSDGTVTPQRLEQAEVAWQEARGNIGAYRAEVEALEHSIEAGLATIQLLANRLERTGVIAPVSGTVLVRAVEAGEYVQTGQTIAVIVDLTDIELKVYVPESDIGKVTLGTEARIGVDAFPERFFDGAVKRVDQQAQFTPHDIHMPEERVRTVFGVTLSVDNDDGILKPGMPADAWLLWDTSIGWPDRLFVPE